MTIVNSFRGAVVAACLMGEAAVQAQDAVPRVISPIQVPGGEINLFEDFRGTMYVVVTGGSSNGVFTIDGSGLKSVVAAQFEGAAVTFSGDVYTTRDKQVLRRVSGGDADTDVTTGFDRLTAGGSGVSLPGSGEVVVTEDGRVWVQGCKRCRETDGSYSVVPARKGGGLLPMARDIAGNDWAVDPTGKSLVVSPAQLRLPSTSGNIVLPPEAIPAWQTEPANHGLPPSDWKFLVADDAGDIWAATDRSLWVLHLRTEVQAGTNNWAQVRDEKVVGGGITALARRPLGGGVLVGQVGGGIVQVMTTDFVDWQAAQKSPGKVSVTVLREKGDGPVRNLWIDRSGRLWAVTGNRLDQVGAPQWQGWRRLPSLPWGVVGAGAVSYGDRLYVGGSLHGIYGLPISSHTGMLDVMAAGHAVAWTPAARLRLGRGFTAATEWRGRLWLMCGTSIPWHGCAPTDWVENFDPKTGELDIGPRTYGWRAHAAAVTWQDRVYVMGLGMRVSAYWGFMESLGAGEKAWRKEEEPPVVFKRVTDGGIYDRVPVSACLLDSVFYVFTSQHGLLSYHPSAQTWRKDLAKAPEMPGEPHILAVNGEVWLVANEAVHAYVPEKDAWRRVAPLPTKREWGFAGRMGDALVIGGGYPCGAGNAKIFASQETFSLAIPKEVRP